jgi:hypothetical protein
MKKGGVNVLTVCPAGMLTSTRAIRIIESQGLLGQKMLMNPNYDAGRSIDLSLA